MIGDRVVQRRCPRGGREHDSEAWDALGSDHGVPVGMIGVIILDSVSPGCFYVCYENGITLEINAAWLDPLLALLCAECNHPIRDIDYLCSECR